MNVLKMATPTGVASRGIGRVSEKLKKSVENGDFYEAHQMYRTLYFRYTSQGKHEQTRKLLVDGAILLLEHGQSGSGADLALLLLESLKTSDCQPDVELVEHLGSMHRLMDADSVERLPFVSNSLKWLKEKDAILASHLHHNYAIVLWQEKNYGRARYHFLHCNDGAGCADMLVEFSISSGFICEVDLFIAQAVFQYLCLKNIQTATVAFQTYTKKHPRIEPGPPFLLPLLNFVWFLLIAIEGGKIAVFTVLCEQYQLTIGRDPSYREYLDRIGQLFFGLPPPQKQTNMFDNLLQNLLIGSDDESDNGDATAQQMEDELD